MKEWERAWLAAAIDGEGTISLHRNGGGKVRPSLRGFSYAPIVLVCNTNLDFCKFAQKITGVGRIQTIKRKAPYKTLYRWVVTGRRCKPILLEICPYLIIKEKHAFSLFEAIGWIEKNTRNTAHWHEARLVELHHQLYFFNTNRRFEDAVL